MGLTQLSASLSCSEPVKAEKRECIIKVLVPGYWEWIRFYTVRGSFLQATHVRSWWDTLEAKTSINGFPMVTQSLWITEGASFYYGESVFWRDSMFACLFSALGRYSAVTVTFSLIAAPKFVRKGQPFVNLSGPLYCSSEYALTLFHVLSEEVSGLVLMQEVPVRICASFSPADSMSLQFLFLLRLSPPTYDWSICL